MSYSSKRGRRPNEYASKSAHSHVVNNPSVQSFLAQCNLPKHASEVTLSDYHQVLEHIPISNNPIQHVIAVDGGYSEVPVQIEFPSANVCFFQIGANIFSIEDLDNLEQQAFIDPTDITKLNHIQRLQFTLPTRNITLHGEQNLTGSVRRAIFDFFCQSIEDEKLIDTLRWFVFQEYDSSLSKWKLASCPICDNRNIQLEKKRISKDHIFSCPYCSSDIFLTDVFRLHEVIDDDLGAGGILGYVTTTLEQIVIIHLIRLILKTKPDLLSRIFFVKDGPLAFFGQTSNMKRPMRHLVNFLLTHYDLFLAGLEKSGPFVDHADEIYEKFEDSSALILDNEYIYKYILPGKADPNNPYGSSTYYSYKLIFKTSFGGMHVVSIPTQEMLPYPQESDLKNWRVILTNVEKLKCDMYDNALIPVALVNKLVSLANHPSSRILQKFAIGTIPS